MACENLAPQIVSRLMAEIRELVRRPPEGIEYLDNEDGDSSVSEIHALITGPEGTPFHKGKFHMKLILSADYPSSPPRGFFLTKIYHPNIAANGDICVNTLKRDWTPDVTFKHILQVIRCLLIVPFPESSLNDEAGKLFMEDYDDFARRARIMTEVHALEAGEKSSSSCGGCASGSGSSSSGNSEVPTEESKKVTTQKRKAKEAKKKGLKRL
jgi:ubiquitin-conjugating enzyme E2 S